MGKMDFKIVLIMLAVFAIGIFASPSTIAMFGGQHNWYDLGPDGNDVPCEKCHADIYDEMNQYYSPHRTYQCSHCHRIYGFGGENYVYAKGDNSGSWPGQEAHAASTVECMECHDLNWYKRPPVEHHMNDPAYATCGWGGPPEGPRNCHAPPRTGWNIDQIRAGGFGITSNQAPVAWSSDTGNTSAHRPFVLDAINSTLMDGTNEACITCHTHTAIDINWSHKYKMSLAADGSSGDWVVENFIAEGTYNVTTYGNMSGGTTGVTTPDIMIEPEPEGYDPDNP